MNDLLLVALLIVGVIGATLFFIGCLVSWVTAMAHSRSWAIASWLIPGVGILYCVRYREKGAYPLRLLGIGFVLAASALLAGALTL